MRRVAPSGYEIHEISHGWELASSPADAHQNPDSLLDLRWQTAVVPGTVAASVGEGEDLDRRDWWFRTRFAADPVQDSEQAVLALDGLATVSEVYLNGARVLASNSMFATHELDVSARLQESNELVIVFRALAPLLARPRRPRARWRTRLVADGNLRFFRTMLLGRAPGFAPGPPAIGPWAPVRLERRRDVLLDAVQLRPRVVGPDGVLALRARLRPPQGEGAAERAVLELRDGDRLHQAELSLSSGPGGQLVAGELTVPGVRRWWPHTHGAPELYAAGMRITVFGRETEIDLGRIGFRTLDCGNQVELNGIRLNVNGLDVFARGAVWTPLDLKRPHSHEAKLRQVLAAAVRAGMNMLRVPGTGCYESETFYDLCDELGILVWQDFMFANLDYPEQDPEFMDAVEREAREVLARLGGRPSLAVLCGGSEVAQQVAMLGLDPALAVGPLFGELLPTLVNEANIDAAYLPSTPWGGDLPFRPGVGVAHYYGVGAYLRGLEDTRRSGVRFAAECLAFSNVPDLDAADVLPVTSPRWKRGVPRDAGAGWDFEDVRDHYLAELFEIDPVALRWSDPERYLELSATVTGELMAEVFGEWRRTGSPCGGGLVLWLTDLVPGAGWGVLDDRGQPKVAYHHLRRALAPVSVWSLDEGLDGISVHVANDQPEPLAANLRVALYRGLEVPVDEVVQEILLPAHAALSDNLERLLGQFVDAAWAYRFGPPAQDLIVLSLERPESGATRPVSQSFRFPVGRPAGRESAERVGLTATLVRSGADTATLALQSRRLLYGVRIAAAGFLPDDDAFCLEPGKRRELELVRVADGAEPPQVSITAANLAGRLSPTPEDGR